MNIFQAKKELYDFLRDHPELRPEQERIDAILSSAVTQNNRMVLLQNMMIENVIKMDALFKSIGILSK